MQSYDGFRLLQWISVFFILSICANPRQPLPSKEMAPKPVASGHEKSRKCLASGVNVCPLGLSRLPVRRETLKGPW